MGGFACSGALLNTTANDHRPMFLSANHCFAYTDNKDPLDWVFYWNFESSGCHFLTINDLNILKDKSTTGANILARGYDTDFMLLELVDDPKWNKNITLYYLGWDRDTTPMPSPSVCIHHFGWEYNKVHYSCSKAIAKTNMQIFPNFNDYEDNYAIFKRHRFWVVHFDEGATYYGSSGSPLLNSNKRVVGQTYNGIYCPSELEKYSLDGILGISWNGIDHLWGVADSSSRLRDWLDPLHTDVQFIDGISGCNQNLWNDTIKRNKVISGCDILHVKNVQIIKNISVDISATETVIINSDFHVEAGSDVYIHISSPKEYSPSPPSSEETNNEIDAPNLARLAPNHTDNIAYQKYNFTLHPNPNNGTFQLETNFSLSEIAHLKITNLLGTVMYETQNLTSTGI